MIKSKRFIFSWLIQVRNNVFNRFAGCSLFRIQKLFIRIVIPFDKQRLIKQKQMRNHGHYDVLMGTMLFFPYITTCSFFFLYSYTKIQQKNHAQNISLQKQSFAIYPNKVFLLCVPQLVELYIKFMTSRFQYNFTRQSQFEQLRDRNRQLEEENSLLKQSLEELIKVNNELTESIEELNNGNNYNQNNQDIEERFEMLIDENRNLREQLENELNSNKTKKSLIEDDNQTESLVNVLEELIESFKNIEMKYESQIEELEQALDAKQNQHAARLAKVEQELSSKISTIEALSTQLKRKDEILETISAKFAKLQYQQNRPINLNKSVRGQEGDIKKLQSKIEVINKNLEQKQKVIKLYETLIISLKGKIMQKY